MLWTYVFDFYIQHIFGGRDSSGVFYIGYLQRSTNYNYDTSNTFLNVLGIDFSIGNYFSFIATIITLVAILLFCVFIIKKIIGIIFRLFTGSSSF